MNTILSGFSHLKPNQVYDLLRLRQQVFIVEQDCIYKDIDGIDPDCFHLLVYDNEILAAYLRILEPGLKFKEASLGRIIVAKDYRGTGLGQELIKSGISFVKSEFDNHSIRIEAQTHLKKYYHSFGFVEEGNTYKVDGINHIQMKLE